MARGSTCRIFPAEGMVLAYLSPMFWMRDTFDWSFWDFDDFALLGGSLGECLGTWNILKLPVTDTPCSDDTGWYIWNSDEFHRYPTSSNIFQHVETSTASSSPGYTMLYRSDSFSQPLAVLSSRLAILLLLNTPMQPKNRYINHNEFSAEPGFLSSI